MTKLADWEITAGGSTINSAAPTGAPEGMAPSAINNKIREDNAIIARDYRNRKGILSAGGTSSAYTLTSAEGDAGDNLTTGDAAMLVFVANKKCEAGVTLAVDGMAAKSIIDASGNNLSEGDITANTLVSVCYNAGTDRWQIMNERASTDAVRAGDATTFTGDNSFEGDSTFKGSAQFQSSIFTQAAVFDAGVGGQSYIDNLALVASVAGNNLTIDIRGKDLNDPSNTNKVNVGFRSENLADGDYDIVSITSALDITIDAGETLGFSASETGYIYVYLMNDGGTVKMAVAKKDLFTEAELHTSTALSASADDNRTLYSIAEETSLPIRLVGRIKITHGSSVWDAAPTELSLNPIDPPDIAISPLERAAAWGQFKGSGTATIIAGHNFASLDDSGVGNYVIHFTNPMASAGYVVLPYNLSTRITANERTCDIQDLTTTSFRLRTGAQGDSGVGGAVEDASLANFVVYGKLA